MIPYLESKFFVLWFGEQPLFINTFNLIFASGIFLAFLRGRHRLKTELRDRTLTYRLLLRVVLPGIVGAWILNALLYLPAEVVSQLAAGEFGVLFAGRSSTGAVLAGALAFVVQRKLIPPAFRAKIADILVEAVLIGFAIGRLGCALAHDHLGQESREWFAVNFPEGARIDLGVLEFLLLTFAILPLSALSLRRARREPGFQALVITVLYGIVRFLLDFLRDADETRLAGLTPAQYLCLAALVVCGYFMLPKRGGPNGLISGAQSKVELTPYEGKTSSLAAEPLLGAAAEVGASSGCSRAEVAARCLLR